MSSPGLTDAGFVRKRLADILSDLNTGMESIYGSNVDLDPDSPEGQLVGLFAGPADQVWELLEELTTIFDPQQSRGTLLNALVQLNGITRDSEIHTSVLVTFYGPGSATIPAGSLVSNGTDDFALLAEVSINPLLGFITGNCIAVDPGPISAAAGTVTTIVTPISGLDSVTNLNDEDELGSLVETDPALRLRRERSAALGAVNTYSALRAALVNVTSVVDVVVIVNETLATDGLGVPGKSYEAVVDGGADQDIIDAIWANHPMGIASAGSTSGTAVDSDGVSHTINFERPADKTIWVTMTLTTDALWPADGDDLIKQAIVDYAAGQLAGHEDKRLGIGDDVMHSRLYTPINSIPGHTVDSLFIDFTTGPAATADLAISDEEISRWDIVRIVVNT